MVQQGRPMPGSLTQRREGAKGLSGCHPDELSEETLPRASDRDEGDLLTSEE